MHVFSSRHPLFAILIWVLLVGIASAAPSPRHGGTIVTVPGVGLAPPAAINGFNPLLTSSAYDAQAEGLMYQPLLWIDQNQRIDWSRSVASGITVGADHRRYTIRLAKRWRWSDGKPVTANDVAYTYHMIVKLGPKFANYGTGGIPTEVASFKVLSPYRIEVVTKEAVNPKWFELNGLSMLQPLPAQAWAHDTVGQLYNRLTDVDFFRVVDGPFSLQAFRAGRYASFVPNPHYSGAQKPYIDRLILRFLTTPQAVFSALRTNEIQIGNLPFPLYPARRQLSRLNTTITTPAWGYGYLGFNYSNPSIAYLRNVKVRLAIMHAIDQDLLIKLEYYGHGVRLYGPVPPVPSTFLSPAAKQLRKKGAYDPALSKRLLAEAGWKPGPEGVVVKDGHPLAFTLYVQPGNTRGPTLIKAMLAEVGIEMHLREKPFNQVVSQMTNPANHSWQAVYLGWSLGTYPTGGIVWNCGGALNAYHYCDKKMDKLIKATTTQAGLDPIYRFQDYFTSQQPAIILPASEHIIKSAPEVHGIKKAFSPAGSFNPQYLWVGKAS